MTAKIHLNDVPLAHRERILALVPDESPRLNGVAVVEKGPSGEPQCLNGTNREHWLENAIEALRSTLTFAGAPRVSVGFPSKGALSRKGASHTIGQCWCGTVAADGRPQVFISPLLGDAVDVLATLLHELIHFKVGIKTKHGREFKAEMKHCGLEGKATATVASAQLRAVLERKADELGPYPHAALDPRTLPRVQGTRLLKAVCPSCDCVIRITKQWAGEDGCTLPWCGACGIEGEPATMTRMVLR